jgi:DNA (cytosine-5)-methyltransferase 1
MKNKMNVLDLFCGAGGMSKGFSDAGFNVVFGIDIWDIAIETYTKNNTHKGICEDLTNLTPENFQSKYNTENLNIDVIIGGIPCQGYSLAGRRDVNDKRNLMYKEFCKYVEYYKPKAIIIENVVGILTMKNSNNEKYLELILNMLSKNYNCDYKKMFAADYQVPQLRPRVIIMGIRKDLNKLPQFPLHKYEHIPIKDILIPKNECDIKLFLSQKAIDGINRRKEQNVKKNNGFGAQYIDLDKPCFTITCRYYKDGYDALVKYSETEIRRLNIIELKKIQTFPEEYIFKGTKKDQIIQLGNAVAVKFAYHVAKELFNILQ